MTSPQQPDRALLQRWLGEARVDHYLCNECEGLHLRALQELDGVIDSRLFLENYGLLLTTELELRPMALLPVAADLGRLNMDYPTLKLFVDVVDDATPQLVAAGTLPTAAGLTLKQFAHFVAATVAATRRLAAECLQQDYLFPAADDGGAMPSNALH
jgi:hypothetical protein